MTGLFSEALRGELKALSESSKIDDAWVKGIKKGWKKLAAQTKDYQGRMDSAPDMDQAAIQEAAYSATKALKNMQRYIQVLRDDLLMDKGFWMLPAPEGKKPTISQAMKAKVVEELDAAETAVAEGLFSIEHVRVETGQTGTHGGVGNYYADSRKSQERFDWYIRSFGARLDEAVDQADAALGRLFRHLNKLLSKSFKHVQVHPTTGSPEWQKKLVWQKQEVPLDFGEIPPEVVHVGKTTIVFHDIPKTGQGVGVVSPARVGVADPKTMDIALKPLGKSQGYMSPHYREKVIDQIRDAREALRSKGLEKLFVGEFHVYPPSQAGENPYGKEFGVGGSYHQDKDAIKIFGVQSSALIVHEIGHRYWDKFMSAEERENFSRFFGDVPAVSKYGAQRSWEDFAEVFAFYVRNKGLTKGQRERFMQFMRGKRPRLEAVQPKVSEVMQRAQAPQKCAFCDNPAVKSFLYANGMKHVPACANHFQEARDKIQGEEDSVVSVVDIIPTPLFRREGADPVTRMAMALERAPDFAYDNRELGAGFGLRVDPKRRQSALSEAPAPIGRADTPRGVTFQSRTGSDIMAISGKPLKRTSTDPLKTLSTEPIQRVAGVEIPDSLMKMLGQDWKSMRVFRQHDNRMLVNVDGVRYTVYTRRG